MLNGWAFLTPGTEKEIINLGSPQPKLIISFSVPRVKKKLKRQTQGKMQVPNYSSNLINYSSNLINEDCLNIHILVDK